MNVTPVNQKFLDFCCGYNTPDRERLREIYESAEMDEQREELELTKNKKGKTQP